MATQNGRNEEASVKDDFSSETPTPPSKSIPSRSSWTVVTTPQDASLLPTLGVTLWLGWNGFLVYALIYLLLFASNQVRGVVIALCIVSVSLPLDFWMSDSSPGRRMGNWCMRMGERYFGLTTTVEDEGALRSIPLDRAAVLAAEPHDILPYAVFAFSPCLGRIPDRIGRDHRCLMTSAIFRIPFLRQAYAWTSGGPVDRATFRRRLSRGESFTFVPGGVQEVTAMDPACPSRDVVLYLRSRKGFVKLALERGSPIVPVFCFGVEGSYGHWIPRGKWAAEVGRAIGFLPLVYWGRYGVPFGIPRPNKIHVVVGSPIDVPMMGAGSIGGDAVDKYHGIFLEEMEALFERHKADAGYEGRKIRII